MGVTALASIKADVEGSEREVLARDPPVILLELLSGTRENPGARTAEICEGCGYDSVPVQHGRRIAIGDCRARQERELGHRRRNRNVLFLPR